MEINEECRECGKVWTEDDEIIMKERVRASMTVTPILTHNKPTTKKVNIKFKKFAQKHNYTNWYSIQT